MRDEFYTRIDATLAELREQGLEKIERQITSPQGPEIEVNHQGAKVRLLNFCANNYLGLADHQEIVAAAKSTMDTHGFGMASVRFICGTTDLHRKVEKEIADFLGYEDSILFAACFDANGGVFEPLLGAEDAIISDALNHASIIDGVRLCKAARYRYANNDMADLERQLIAAGDARFRMIATDGVFSMDGIIANLPAICDLAEQYDATVMVDDSHAVGFIGDRGAGTPEYWGVEDRIDIVTGTLGKALGGASGGYTSGPAEVIEILRQRSRPYLFSNSLAPTIAATTRVALGMLRESDHLRDRLRSNASRFRAGMEAAGFSLGGADHPIIPVMLGDATVASTMADRLLDEGVYVIGFSFPVVPRGEARIRTQMSAAHTREHIDAAIEAFSRVGTAMGVIG